MNNNKKVVLITGAASGMGLASAKRFKKDGWVVYGTDLFPSAKNGDKFPTGPECILISPVNVTSEEEQQKVVDIIVSKHGRIDTCVVKVLGWHLPNDNNKPSIKTNKRNNVNKSSINSYLKVKKNQLQ